MDYLGIVSRVTRPLELKIKKILTNMKSGRFFLPVPERSLLVGVFGFLLLLTPSSAEDCAIFPQKFVDVANECASSLTEADIALIGADQPDGGKLKEFALCFYKGIGYFQDGAFNVDFVVNFLTQSKGRTDVADRVIARTKQDIVKANELQGDEAERAYAFYLTSYRPEIREVANKFWCD
ncbi:uncharacterized protein [Fopius arisanus]|uniref:DBP3 protein n=1 Tax=Fopius arisanus TaxID=64838 RepID=A0A0C9R8C3_9HYME|nr:PREDICTED: uncharacterized protein LOC105273673 [Fopius arisanus]